MSSSDSCKPWTAPLFETGDADSVAHHTGAQPSLLTQKQLEVLRQRAYEKGFARGVKDGMLHGAAEIQEQVANLQSIMATLAMPLLDLDKQVVEELVELCMMVTRQMVRRELKISPGEVVAVVKEALSLLPVTAGDVRLELHPEDAAVIREALLNNDSQPPWTIIEDPILTRGGCRVMTNTSRIDATVEQRINNAIAAVMGGERLVDMPS